MDGATANKMVEKYGSLVAFGRHFIANVSSAGMQLVGPFLEHILARSPFVSERGILTDAL